MQAECRGGRGAGGEGAARCRNLVVAGGAPPPPPPPPPPPTPLPRRRLACQRLFPRAGERGALFLRLTKTRPQGRAYTAAAESPLEGGSGAGRQVPGV